MASPATSVKAGKCHLISLEREMEGGEEGAEILWEKVRRVGKRGGHSTPAASFWRTNELGLSANVSSRKLAAALWELHHYKPPLDNTRRRVDQLDVGGAEPLHPPPTSFQLVKTAFFFFCSHFDKKGLCF